MENTLFDKFKNLTKIGRKEGRKEGRKDKIK
jgi:hypothetical protein